MAESLSEHDWQLRLYIYAHFSQVGTPPSLDDAAQHFSLDVETIRAGYHRLNQSHHIFLNPGTDDILMAHPLSAVQTDYQVHLDGRSLWANCAWDSLGIPVMLGEDATIEVRHALSREPIHYQVLNGQFRGGEGLVHFALPVRRWYDDLVHT